MPSPALRRGVAPGGAAILLTTTLALLLSLLVAAPASAAQLTVTANRIDSGDGDDTDPAPDGCQPDDCSLREAVIDANASAGADEILFAEAGTITLTLSGPEADATNDLDVEEELTITGHADGTEITSDLTLGPDSRAIESSAPLTLTGVVISDFAVQGDGGGIHISDELLTLTDSAVLDTQADGQGGAIYLASAAVVLDGSSIQGATAGLGGGGIGTDDVTSIEILGSTLSGNTAVANPGGAVSAVGAQTDSPITVRESTLTGNHISAPPGGVGIDARGGAIHVERGTLTVERSLFLDNGLPLPESVTASGGAIHAEPGGDVPNVAITDAVFTGNRVTGDGGALFLGASSSDLQRTLVSESEATGGAVFIAANTGAQIVNSTFSGNAAPGGPAAALYVQPQAGVAIQYSTIAGNTDAPVAVHATGADVSLASSIVANAPMANCDAPVTSLDFNVADDATCGLAGADDLQDTDPAIGPLAVSGSVQIASGTLLQTRTHAPTPDSPAVDSADPATCGGNPYHVDQRGAARPDGAGCERGAHEGPADDDTPPPPPGDGCDVSAPGAPAAEIVPGINRVAGLNRIQTAIAASQAICGDGQAPAVVLTRSDNFPDAQAGTPLAIALGAPLLLSGPTTLDAETEAEITRVLPPGGDVYLLGGTAALSDAVEARLADLGYSTIRYGGINRFETAAIIADEGLGNPDTLLAADGGTFADSVIAGAASLAVGGGTAVEAAVILTSDVSVPPETQAYLDGRVDDPTIIAVGANGAAAFPDAESVTGPSRFETALAVADRFFTDPTVVGIATADQFADALSGGAVVGRPDIGPGPMLLTATGSLPASVADWLADRAGTITTVVIFGGESAVSAEVEAALAAALGL